MYELLTLKGAWMPQCNMSKQSGTILVASLKPYVKHKISNKTWSGKTSACGVISLRFYLLTNVCKFSTLLCVLATSVLKVQYQFSIYTFRSFIASPMQLYDKDPGDIVFEMYSYQVLPPFEQSLLKLYTHHHHSKLLCSALSTIWGFQ
jgi:hypothetical protein